MVIFDLRRTFSMIFNASQQTERTVDSPENIFQQFLHFRDPGRGNDHNVIYYLAVKRLRDPAAGLSYTADNFRGIF